MYDGIVLNPAAYTHTSVALLDALKAVGIPTVEVHISDVDTREEFRRVSYVRAACIACIKGHGFAGVLRGDRPAAVAGTAGAGGGTAMRVTVTPGIPQGTVRVPTSKSVAHRY